MIFLIKASADYVLKTKDDLMKMRKECIAELKIPETLVAEYQKRVFTPEGVTPCYIRCVFSRLGLFDDSTGFLTDHYLTQLNKGETVRAGVTGCYDNSGTDKCLWAYRGFICLSKNGYLPEGY